MGLFQKVEGEAAIVIFGGVYKQCDVYTRDGYLYAAVAGGFVRLYDDGSTTKPKMNLNHLSLLATNLHRDVHGRLCLEGVDGAKRLDGKKAQILIGAAGNDPVKS